MTAQKGSSSSKPVKGKRLRWILLIVFGLLLLGLVWFGYSAEPEITGLRNVVHYKMVKALGGPRVRTGEPAGSISGTVREKDGDPVAGAMAPDRGTAP